MRYSKAPINFVIQWSFDVWFMAQAGAIAGQLIHNDKIVIFPNNLFVHNTVGNRDLK